MQTLWARAAQVRSTCRCSLCSSPANALTPRVAGVPAWRRVTQGNVLLVFSSTLAFEAALYNAVRNDAKSKEQWNRVIVEGRERIAAVEADQKKRIQALLDSAEQRASEDDRDWKNRDWENQGTAPLDWTWQGVFSWATRVDESRRFSGFEGWKGPALSFLNRLTANELRELQSSKHVLRSFYGGPDCANLVPLPYTEPLSTQKLRILEWSTAKLVLKIMWAFCGEGSCENIMVVPPYMEKVTGNGEKGEVMKEKGGDRPGEEGMRGDQRHTVPLQEIWPRPSWPKMVQKAQSTLRTLFEHPSRSNIHDYFERPSIPCYDDPVENYDDGRICLNNALHVTLQKMKDKAHMGLHLAELCQQLLLSRTPPNVHAYNLLLVRFSEIEETSLVHYVLEAMWESKIRPNEITHATVLRFYTVTGNKSKFSLYVKRMRGLKNGLALANPNIALSPLLKTQVHVFGHNLQKVAEKARMNHEVFSALIIGLLRFFDPEDAMYWYRAMIDQGWRPTAELLTAILRECCLRCDWTAGVAVWHQFAKETIDRTSSAYEWMLRLCQSCKQCNVYHSILDDGVRDGMLPAAILDHAHGFWSKDAKTMISDAQRETPSIEKYRDMVDPALLQQFDQFQTIEVEEGRPFLVTNSLSGVLTCKAKLNAKLQISTTALNSLRRFKTAVARHEASFSKLSEDIALTISEIGRQLPMIRMRKTLLKMGLTGSLPSIHNDPSPKNVLASYDKYRDQTLNQLERRATLIPPALTTPLHLEGHLAGPLTL